MKLRKITITVFTLLILLCCCNNDDDIGFTAIPDRDRTEVYEENLAQIEEFLRTHFYNSEDFDFTDPTNPQNDLFKIEFTPIEEDMTRTPLIDESGNLDPHLEMKMVDGVDGLTYKLYYLQVREGSGDNLHPADEAFLSYQGTTVKTDENDKIIEGDVFDSAVTPIKLNLTFVSDAIPGVIDGFREGMIEFKTSTNYTDNGDGTITYHDYGIGALFIPSGLAYFSAAVGTIGSYESLIFKIGLVDRADTDFDLDRIPSYLEDLNEDGNVFTEDTDGDFVANFIDNDDDGDGVLTRDELDYNTYVVDTNNGETEPELEENEYEYERSNVNGVITIETFVIVFSNTEPEAVPDYLDPNITPE